MRFAAKILVATVALASLVTAAIAAAPNVVGKWNGKIQMDLSKMPKPKSDQEKKMRTQMLEGMKKMKMTLNLKADKTFTVTVTFPGAPKATNVEGKWTQNGSKLTLNATKEDGKPASKQSQKPQTLTISKDGKTLTMVPEGSRGGDKVVFTK